MRYTTRPTLYGNEYIVTYDGKDIGSVTRVHGNWYPMIFDSKNGDRELKGFYRIMIDAIGVIVRESTRSA